MRHGRPHASQQAAVLALLLISTARLGAQTVRGTVREAGSGAPMQGAFVSLLDSLAVARVSVLTDTGGHYIVRAPFPASYRVRAELIGHRTAVSPATPLTAGALATVDLAVGVEPIAIASVEAQAGRRCKVRPDAAVQTARVWEEVRKALRVAAWSEKQNAVQLETRSYERVLDARNLSLLQESVRSGESRGRAYAAVNPDTLARYGFVRTLDGDTSQFFGPDADVLLSDAFLDTHCFSVTRGTDRNRGLLGLTFEPLAKHKLQDVTGTLWLDPQSSELKYIDFRYTRLPRKLDFPGVGGETHFRRLGNGAWIVERWFIRLPVAVFMIRDYRLHAYSEVGGEIIAIKSAHADYAMPKTRVTGSVWDSTRAQPLAFALVYLSGTGYRTRTDAAGNFVLDSVPEGSYNIAFGSSWLDTLPHIPPPRAVHVRGAALQVQLAIPAARTLIAEVCPDARAAGVVTGYVLDRAGEPLSDVRVEATWGLFERTTTLHAASDRSGRFVICGLPSGRDIRLSASAMRPQLFRIEAIPFLRRDVLPL